jgi:hypothetical protein
VAIAEFKFGLSSTWLFKDVSQHKIPAQSIRRSASALSCTEIKRSSCAQINVQWLQFYGHTGLKDFISNYSKILKNFS